MEIKYMKAVQDYPTRGSLTNEPLTIAEIQALETKYNNGKEFPIAYREFLFLCGKFSNCGLNTSRIDYLQERSRELLMKYGGNIDRPFLVFKEYEGCYQFGFFYLDEYVEDPKYYNCEIMDEGAPLITESHFTFSELINECIRRVKNGLGF